MRFSFRPRIRHPYFPGLNPISAEEAKGCVTCLCGGFPELERAAARGVRAERAVLVLLEWNAPPFTSAQRDRLWELFQIPIYGMLLGHDRRVAAFECEAHNGFHVPFRGGETEVTCECGRPGPLLDSQGVLNGGKKRLAAAGAEAL